MVDFLAGLCGINPEVIVANYQFSDKKIRKISKFFAQSKVQAKSTVVNETFNNIKKESLNI